MLMSFVTTAGYGGALRAFLMTPNLKDPVDTVERALESGLPRQTIVYGEQIEHMFESHENKNYKEFWRGMEVVGYDPFPYERVS